jgi:hypothetical protein
MKVIMARDDFAQVFGREDEDAGPDAEPGSERLFDFRGGVALAAGRGSEDGVAAVPESANARVAKALQQRAENGHRDALRAPDVDATEEGDGGWHWGVAGLGRCTLPVASTLRKRGSYGKNGKNGKNARYASHDSHSSHTSHAGAP